MRFTFFRRRKRIQARHSAEAKLIQRHLPPTPRLPQPGIPLDRGEVDYAINKKGWIKLP